MANNMIKWESILIGIIIVGIATIASLVSSSSSSGGSVLAILIAGLVVGFLVKDVKSGVVNGAIFGVIGGLIKLLITFSMVILSFYAQYGSQLALVPADQLSRIITMILLQIFLIFIIDVIVATLSGAVGSLIRTGFEESSVQESESTYPHTALTVIGYIFGILGGIIGLIIAIYLLTREDKRAKTHALIILGIFVLWIAVSVMVIYPLMQQMFLA